MKRWVLFAGAFYYPSGGASDIIGSYDTAAEALAVVRESWDGAERFSKEWNWWNLLDTETGQISGGPDYWNDF